MTAGRHEVALKFWKKVFVPHPKYARSRNELHVPHFHPWPVPIQLWPGLTGFCITIARKQQDFCITIARKHQQKIVTYHKNSPQFRFWGGFNDFIKMDLQVIPPSSIDKAIYFFRKKNLSHQTVCSLPVVKRRFQKGEKSKLLPNSAIFLHLSSILIGGGFEPSQHNQWCMNGVPRYRYHGHYQNICKIYEYITVTIKKNIW